MSFRAIFPLALLVGACEHPAGVRFPGGAEPIIPPAVYRDWWVWTQACAGVDRDFDAVSWYAVPGVASLPGENGAMGAWFPQGNRIVIAEAALLNGAIVRHEMLHAITHAGHSREHFVGRCGGVVACDEKCQSDGGPPLPRPTGAEYVTAGALKIGLEIWPTAAGAGIPVDVFALVIMAQNPRPVPVIVALAPTGGSVQPVSYEYRVNGPDGMTMNNVRADVPEVTWFAPGETKRFIFDFHTGRFGVRSELPPGSWVLTGAYGSVWAPAALASHSGSRNLASVPQAA